MKLRALRLHNVKRFAGRGVSIENIGDGVNVLAAANEFGKSTSFEALHALFFQPHSGTPNSVKLLRPYAGGNPLVEADIETKDGAFRLTKQFYGGRYARIIELGNNRLVAQADEAEAFIANLTKGGAGGPAGLLWVRQGLTGIEKRSTSEEESDRRVRETLLSSVQGEVEALTGGRRMAEILMACEEALGRLVTPSNMKPKAGGPYKDALDEQDRLAALEQQLSADVAALRDALDRRRIATRRLAQLEAPEEVEARREEIKVAEEASQAARSHRETLLAAEAGLALAVEQHRAAAVASEQFQNALDRAGQLERRATASTQRLDLAKARHADARAESDRLQAEMQAAEAGERQALEDKARLDAAQDARDAAERFDAANDRLTQAEAIRTRLETGDALLATLLVPKKALEQLEDLDLELARLSAVQSAALPSLRMVYANPADTSIALAGKPLTHDAHQNFSGTIDLDIAHVGRLTIRSRYVDDAGQAIAAVQDKVRMLLVSVGVESIAAARQRRNIAREKSDALTLDRQLLGQLAPDGIETLREAVTRLDALRGDRLEIKFDASAIIEALRSADADVVASRNAVREARPMTDAAHQEFLAAHAAHAELQAELRALEATLGASSQRPAKVMQIDGELQARRERLLSAEAAVEPLRARVQDLAAAELSLKRVRAVAQAADQEIKLNRETLADLNGQIRTQADKAIEENWQETKDLLTAATDKAHRYEVEVKTLDRLRTALTSARSSARDLYLKPVITELRPLIGLLFDDITVAFNETTLLPKTVLRNGQQEEVERLSGGMREQLSILTRLAFARLLARDGRSAPVILDDALVYSDDDRIERMFEALHSQSRDQQILIFSCRQRAFSRLGGNVLSISDWSPP
ncbi:AAA family ATPase [uncultured Devosia sp.]|uniref:AAA family ATPase n=1 Tax=uncultured Devosia sp. TaxID=211434 RepID=UPI0035CB266F